MANIEVKTDGSMTVQFLPEINNPEFDEERVGWISIFSKFGNVETGEGGNTTITFEVNGVSKDVTVKFEEEVIEETKKVTLKKAGEYNTENNEIKWTIKVKAKTTPAGGSVENVVIKDIFETGQSFIQGSATLDGVPITSGQLTGNELIYSFTGPIEDGVEHILTFKTKADLSKFVEEGANITFKNEVSGTFGPDNKEIDKVEAKVTTKVNFISKKGSYDAKNKNIKWTIYVNSNNLDLPAGVVVKDILGGGLEFNNDMKVNGDPYGNHGSLSANGSEFTFTNPISTRQTITYSTKVIDPDAFTSNVSKKYYNEAIVTVDGQNLSSGNIGVELKSTIIKKSAGVYNADRNEITWKITINDNKVKIIDPVITDTLPDELEYVSHTITGSKTWVANNSNGSLKLKHFGEINETYTINLVTRIKATYMKEFFGYNGSKKIYNNVKLEGECIETSTAKDSKTITSKIIEKFARGYDYTRRTAKWEILVNQNNKLITNAVITDILGSNSHVFVEGSLKVDGIAVNASDYIVSGNTLTINLGNITTQKSITFETQIPADKVNHFFKENGEKELKNKAILTGDEIKDGGE